MIVMILATASGLKFSGLTEKKCGGKLIKMRAIIKGVWREREEKTVNFNIIVVLMTFWRLRNRMENGK